jgi:hypothetical protein
MLYVAFLFVQRFMFAERQSFIGLNFKVILDPIRHHDGAISNESFMGNAQGYLAEKPAFH